MTHPVCSECGDSITYSDLTELDGMCRRCANQYILGKTERTLTVPVINSVAEAVSIIRDFYNSSLLMVTIGLGDYEKLITNSKCLPSQSTNFNTKSCLYTIFLKKPTPACATCHVILPILKTFVYDYLQEYIRIEELDSIVSDQDDLKDFIMDICEHICIHGDKGHCLISPTLDHLRWCYKNFIEHGTEGILRYEKMDEDDILNHKDEAVTDICNYSISDYEQLPFSIAGVSISTVEIIKIDMGPTPKIMFFERTS